MIRIATLFSFEVLRSLTSYQQLMLNRLAGGRVVVLGGEECQGSRGETGLLSNSRNGNDVQGTLVWFNELSMYGKGISNELNTRFL